MFSILSHCPLTVVFQFSHVNSCDNDFHFQHCSLQPFKGIIGSKSCSSWGGPKQSEQLTKVCWCFFFMAAALKKLFCVAALWPESNVFAFDSKKRTLLLKYSEFWVELAARRSWVWMSACCLSTWRLKVLSVHASVLSGYSKRTDYSASLKTGQLMDSVFNLHIGISECVPGCSADRRLVPRRANPNKHQDKRL